MDISHIHPSWPGESYPLGRSSKVALFLPCSLQDCSETKRAWVVASCQTHLSNETRGAWRCSPLAAEKDAAMAFVDRNPEAGCFGSVSLSECRVLSPEKMKSTKNTPKIIQNHSQELGFPW